MAELTPNRPRWRGIYQLETTDPILGGPLSFDPNGDPIPSSAPDNVQAQMLADRTEFLLARVAGAAVMKKNAVVQYKRDNGGLPDFIQVNGTDVTIEATVIPLMFAFSLGHDQGWPSVVHGYLDQDYTVTLGQDAFTVYAEIDPDTLNVSIIFEKASSLTYFYGVEYNAPTVGIGDGTHYYDATLQKMFRYDGVQWSPVNRIYLGIVITIAGIEGVQYYDFLGKSGDAIFTDDPTPPGTVITYAQPSPPPGYLMCDGSDVDRIQYARLFSIIGTTFGVGDGSTTFTLPDLRGEFIRGYDAGRGIDPGRLFGDWQHDELGSHSHTYSSPTGASAGSGVGSSFSATIDNTGITGGSETRPRNVALMFCIKY